MSGNPRSDVDTVLCDVGDVIYVIGVPSTPGLSFPCHLRVPTLTDLRLHHALALHQEPLGEQEGEASRGQ